MLVDRIYEQPEQKIKNKFLFPLIKDTAISFTILSYAFHLDKARTLLRRLSRTGVLISSAPINQNAQYEKFKKKVIEIPLYSNQTFVLKCDEFEKYYKIIEAFDYLNKTHQDAVSLRTICSINNLGDLKNLKTLHHPHAFSLLSQIDNYEKIKPLLESNQLEEFSFDMKLDNPSYNNIFQLIK